MERPYTSPDEDPFVRALPSSHPPPRRRRSTMLDKWRMEVHQEISSELDTSVIGLQSSAWLAYPELSRPDAPDIDTCIVEGYDLLEDIDIPHPQALPSITMLPSPSDGSLKFLRGTPSLRGISLNLRPPNVSHHSNPSSSRKSFFSQSASSRPSSPTHRKGSKHSRSTSLSVVSSFFQSDPTPPPTLRASKWRPSVLGHFSPGPVGSSNSHESIIHDPDLALPRPSLSSTVTSTSKTSYDLLGASVNFWQSQTILWRRLGYSQASSPFPGRAFKEKHRGIVSLLTSRDDTSERTQSPTKVRSSKAGTVSKLSLSLRMSQKKILVISGIHPEDDTKIEAARQWCENFGTLSRFEQLKNGDLHISFRSSEVADTVCRLRTQVFIAFVGSVQISWFNERRNPQQRTLSLPALYDFHDLIHALSR
ncbi:hypothetical protein DL96DRAFT_1702440 [Flagelloscypha sp. PMI_526]|nr:hypothetical protein DL96DRAFT_1702440 [Flagelloscypha sp. PMI_526]